MHVNVFTKKLARWNEIHSIHPYPKRGWLYRGQGCACWTLKTTLERCCEVKGFSKLGERQRIESHLIRDFKRAYHQYAPHIPVGELEWISLMQHHGAPTRFLDFTYSIYVAAYFALEDAKLSREDSTCAVWAVNGPWALEQSIKAFRSKMPHAVDLVNETQESHEEIASNLLFKEPFVKAVVQLIPFRLNERLRTQRGTFLVPGNISDSFMDNLASLPGYEKEENVLKIEIPVAMRNEAIEQLFSMNISRASLFPGLDGYSESLRIFHPSFVEDPYEIMRRKFSKRRKGFTSSR